MALVLFKVVIHQLRLVVEVLPVVDVLGRTYSLRVVQRSLVGHHWR